MKSTPWGVSQQTYQIERGVSWVSTASHGGLMVAAGVAEAKLSVKARACAELYCGYFCFEEDCDYMVAWYDVPEWARLMYAKDAKEWEPYLGQSAYGMTTAKLQEKHRELIALAHATDDQTRDRLRLGVLRWNPEYFDLGGCQRDGEAGSFGLSCVKLGKAEMCEPCQRTKAEIDRVRAGEVAS